MEESTQDAIKFGMIVIPIMLALVLAASWEIGSILSEVIQELRKLRKGEK